MAVWFKVNEICEAFFSPFINPYSTLSHSLFVCTTNSVAIPSFLTLFVPMACRSSFAMALFIRVIIGFFESATFPAVFHFFPIWVPISEKTFMIPFIVSGMYVGEIIGFSLSGYLANSVIMIGGDDYGGWPSIFYVFGLAGLIWFPLWAIAAHESPAVHPYITKEEILFIYGGTRCVTASSGLPIFDFTI